MHVQPMGTESARWFDWRGWQKISACCHAFLPFRRVNVAATILEAARDLDVTEPLINPEHERQRVVHIVDSAPISGEDLGLGCGCFGAWLDVCSQLPRSFLSLEY
jgi:hypothetical protein